MIELLAPAGNENCFYAAVNNGADAVYLGMSSFSARRNAGNFTEENIGFYVSYAHALGVKVYVALNTIVKDGELRDFLHTAYVAYSVGADALIVQDVFLGKLIKEFIPDCILHLSTQAGVNNLSGAKLAVEYGFSRVILSRETDAYDVKKIAEQIETEIFVHGALCSSFSGHCYISSFIGGNSGNRGLCKQPCRKKYEIETKTGSGKYSFSLADLNLSGEISEIEKLGVKSIKIEGRMRTPEYVAAAVRLYRNALDGASFDESEIRRTYNRGNYTEGYTFGLKKDIISDKIQNHCGEYYGKVKKVFSDKIIIDSPVSPRVGDGFKIIRNGTETGNAVCFKEGRELNFKGDVKIGDTVSITKDVRLSEKLAAVPSKKKGITVNAYFIEGEKPRLESCGIAVIGDEVLEKASTSPVTEEQIRENLSKTDRYPFSVTAEISLEGSPFMVRSKMNKMRAELYEKIFSRDVKSLKNVDFKCDFSSFSDLSYKGVVMCDKACFVPSDYAFVLRPCSYDDAEAVKRAIEKIHANKFVFVPAFLSEKDEKTLKELLPLFDGIYADGLSGIALWKGSGRKIIAGTGMNVFNSADISALNKEGINDLILSKELSLKEISEIKGNGYVLSFGAIKLAEFLYCPFGRECSACKRGDEFSVNDETGHKFILRRYRLGGRCRFELYNGDLIKTDKIKYNFYNFIGFSESEAKAFFESEANLKNSSGCTCGNLKRGVL